MASTDGFPLHSSDSRFDIAQDMQVTSDDL